MSWHREDYATFVSEHSTAIAIIAAFVLGIIFGALL